jgi:sec-independent protein translocase protein TatB
VFNIGPVELMVVLVLALLVFGPAKLPELLGSVGHAIREFQRASRELTEVFQETQQDFQSALDLDQQHQAHAAAAEYEVPAVDVASAVPQPVTAQPEEFETAAAMVDPVEPFQPPVELVPEPEPEAEPVAAVAEPPKPKRSRRKKVEEPVAEPPTAEEPAAEPAVAEPAVAEESMAAQPIAAEVTTTITQGVTASTPVEEPAPNGTAPHVNGTSPKPRRRRATVAAASAPGDESS